MDFGDGVKKVFLAGVGAIATTAETAKELVDTLVDKGEITVEQGKIFNEELKHNIKEKAEKHVTVNVTSNYDDAFQAVDKMSEDDLAKLKEKIDEKEQALKEAASQPEAEDATQE